MNNAPPPEATETASDPALRRQIGLIFFTIILLGGVDGTTGILIPNFQAYYSLNSAVVGQLFLFSTTGYLVASISYGLTIYRMGQRAIFLLGTGAFLLSISLISLRPPFMLVLMLQLFQGYGAAILDITLNTFLTHLPRRVTLLSYLHATHSIGAILSPILATSLLSQGVSWNWMYLIWTCMGLIVLVGLPSAFKGKNEQEKTTVHQHGVLHSLHSRIIILSTAFFFLFVGVEFSLGSWSYSFLLEARHGSPLFMGWIVGGYWCGELVGRLTLARCAERVGENNMLIICLAGSIIVLFVIWLAPSLALVAVGLFLTGVCFGPVAALCMSHLSQHIPAELLPGAMGLLLCFGTIGNALFSWGAGNLAHSYGIQTLLPYEMLIAGAAFICWQLVSFRSGSSTGRVSPDTADDTPRPDRK